MKHIKNYYVALAMTGAMLCGGLTSCSDDDDIDTEVVNGTQEALDAACKQQAERCQQNNGQKSQVLFHAQFLSQKKMLEMICIHYKSAQKRRRLTGG